MQSNRDRLSQNDLAKALGLAPSAVTKLKKQGMPVDSVQSAMEWRRRNVRFDMRAKRPPALSADAAAQRVTALSLLALQALECGEFQLVEAELRSALQSLPVDADVSMPLEVWDALTGHIFAKVTSSPNWEPAALDDREAAAMGKFWLSIASGKLTPLPSD